MAKYAVDYSRFENLADSDEDEPVKTDVTTKKLQELHRTDPQALDQMEAEVKHGRLAMLAILGWLAVENHPLFGEFTLQAGGRAPSLLNGGLFSDNGKWVLAFFALVGVYETQATFGDARLPKQATKLGKLHHEDLGGDAAAHQWLSALAAHGASRSRNVLQPLIAALERDAALGEADDLAALAQEGHLAIELVEEDDRGRADQGDGERELSLIHI